MTGGSLWRAVAIMLGLGVIGGIAWRLLARPAKLESTEFGIVLTESASAGRFGVIVVFVVLGFVLSAGWGWYLGRTEGHRGWPIVLVACLASSTAAVIAVWVGTMFGSPDPTTVTGLEIGETVPQPLEIDAPAAYLVWPIAALMTLLWQIYSSAENKIPAR